MTREIKFRAWDKEYQCMSSEFNLTSHSVTWFGKTSSKSLPFGEELIEQLTIMQFTGLCDKNGVDVFDGDILTSELYPFQDEGKYNYHGIVEWSDEHTAFFLTMSLVNQNKRGISDGISETLMNYDMADFEVIGNIWQNPNLLRNAYKVTSTDSLMNEISAQTQRVHQAYECWDMCDREFEDAAWLAYQSEMARLNALVREAKREAIGA